MKQRKLFKDMKMGLEEENSMDTHTLEWKMEQRMMMQMVKAQKMVQEQLEVILKMQQESKFSEKK